MTTRYVARINGEIVAKRTTRDRTYAFCVLIRHVHPDCKPRSSWCSRRDLAEKEARNWNKGGSYTAVILPAEVL